MSLRRRLTLLEGRLCQAAGQRHGDGERASEWADEEWLERFAAWGAAGFFAEEPDFLTALAWYEEAIAQARVTPDPLWEPPASYLPHLPLRARRREWRRGQPYPGVTAAWFWLIEMLQRIRKLKSAVTEA
jgi:hypothetical protein